MAFELLIAIAFRLSTEPRRSMNALLVSLGYLSEESVLISGYKPINLGALICTKPYQGLTIVTI